MVRSSLLRRPLPRCSASMAADHLRNRCRPRCRTGQTLAIGEPDRRVEARSPPSSSHTQLPCASLMTSVVSASAATEKIKRQRARAGGPVHAVIRRAARCSRRSPAAEYGRVEGAAGGDRHGVRIRREAARQIDRAVSRLERESGPRLPGSPTGRRTSEMCSVAAGGFVSAPKRPTQIW